jgi:hypothetical protein
MNATLPATPSAGDVIALADARGTWGTNPVVVLRNGAKIEGTESDFTNNAAGTFFSLLYIDSTTGWRVLASGTKPLNLTAPTITGTYAFNATSGTWTGSPASYAYQWQISDNGTSGWTDIDGATSASYLATEEQEEKFVRVGVIATNANGPSAVAYSAASAEIDIPPFPLTGLVGFWKLDDLTDASGNDNTLTNNNSVTFGAGKIGNAAEFDGTNNLAVSPNPISEIAQHSFSFWLKNTTSGGEQGCLGGLNANFWIHTKSDKLVAWFGSNPITSTADITPNVWTHCVIVFDDGDVSFYINGALDATGTTTVAPQDSYPDLVLGAANQEAQLGLTGGMDAVGIWNRALTEPEIAQLYGAGTGLEL